MRFLASVSVLVLCVAAFGAHAEDNVIKVINDDGSVSVINIGPNGGAPVTLEPTEAPKEKSVKIAAPEREEAVKEDAPAKAEKKSGQKEKAPKKEAKAKPVKEVKPVPPKPVSNPYKPALPPGAELTREEAMAVAIENTSMIARGLDAFPRTLDGRKVWVVVFKTDQGERDILVDSKTGEIVRVKN